MRLNNSFCPYALISAHEVGDLNMALDSFNLQMKSKLPSENCFLFSEVWYIQYYNLSISHVNRCIDCNWVWILWFQVFEDAAHTSDWWYVFLLVVRLSWYANDNEHCFTRRRDDSKRDLAAAGPETYRDLLAYRAYFRVVESLYCMLNQCSQLKFFWKCTLRKRVYGVHVGCCFNTTRSNTC